MILAKKKKKIRSNNFKKGGKCYPDQMAKQELLTSLIVLFVVSFQRHGTLLQIFFFKVTRSFTELFSRYHKMILPKKKLNGILLSTK